MMKRLIILFTLLFTLFFVLTGCDNGSAPDSSSSGLVKVCFTVDGASSSVQKTASINGFDFTYQYKAVPQWTSDENIYGKTASWTNINYSDGMSLGYFTPGQWIFYIQILSGSTVVYEGHSNVIAISKSSANITISVARIIKETTPGLSISITAPTSAGNALTVSWEGGSASANVSSSGGITTFTYSKNDLADGTYTITLTHSNGQIAPYVVSNVSINSTNLTLIRGHLNNGEWNVTCETLQFYDVNLKRYNWNDVEHPWDASLDPKYCGTVDYIDSAVPGERVSFSPKPDSNSRVVSVEVKCGDTDVAYVRQGTLYSFIMPEGIVTIKVKFADSDSVEVDALLFKTVVRALYNENVLTVKYFGKAVNEDGNPGAGAVRLGDVDIWYNSSTFKICWKANNAEEKAHLTDDSLAGLFSNCVKLTSINMAGIDTSAVTDTARMFHGCTGLTSLNLTGFDASNNTDMSGMFQDCTSLTSLSLAGLDASNVTDMSGMFQGCTNLTSLNLTGFDASGATKMSNMFQDCTSLPKTGLTLAGFVPNTSTGVNMAGLFMNCTSLNGEFDISCFDGCKVTNLAGMFQGCANLTILDLSGLVTNNASDMSYLFSECVKLKTVTLTGLNTGNVKDMQYMFYKAGFNYFPSYATGTGAQNYSNNSSNLSIIGMNFNTSKVEYMNNMFNLCSIIDFSGTNVSNWNVRNVKDMTYMFAGYTAPNESGTWKYWNAKFTSLNLSGSDWVTSSCEHFDYMFVCSNRVLELDISKFDFSKAKTATHMFDRCEKVTKITFPEHTDLSSMQDLEGMFFACMALDGTNFGTYIVERWDIRNCYLNGGDRYAEPPDHGFKTYGITQESNPAYIGANRLISSNNKTHDDFNSVRRYYTYGNTDEQGNRPANGPEVHIGGNNLSNIDDQRLVMY